MNGQITKRMAWCGVWLGSLGLTAPSQAGPLFDWLFHRQPQAAVATTAGYAPTGTSCGAGYCEQTVLQYVPQVAYRTVWEAVPVTTYRRTVSYNPANGLPMTCTQPCTSYTYQARRVPYTTFRPVYATVPVTAPATYAAPTAVAPAVTAPVAAPGCNCAGGYGAQAPMPQSPYYSTPAATPGATTPGATPWEPVPRAGLPGTATPPSTYVAPDEADRIPRIDPGLNPNADDGAQFLPRIPSTSDSSSGYATTRGFRDEYYRRPTEWTTVPPADRSSAAPPTQSQLQSPGTTNSSATSLWSSDQRAAEPRSAGSSGRDLDSRSAASSPFAVQPIPNLDSRSDNLRTTPEVDNRSFDSGFRGPSLAPPERNEAPPLLNGSRDRTALIQPIPTRWASNRIDWPERQVGYEEELQDQPPARSAIYRTESGRRLDTHREPAVSQEVLRPRSTDGWRSSAPNRDGWKSSR